MPLERKHGEGRKGLVIPGIWAIFAVLIYQVCTPKYATSTADSMTMKNVREHILILAKRIEFESLKHRCDEKAWFTHLFMIDKQGHEARHKYVFVTEICVSEIR